MNSLDTSNNTVGGKLGEIAKNGRVCVIGLVSIEPPTIDLVEFTKQMEELHEQYKDKEQNEIILRH